MWRALFELDGLRRWDPVGAVPQAGYPVALYLGVADRRPSFHFARPDRDGAWWHKVGDNEPERLVGLPPQLLRGHVFQGMRWFDPDALNRGYVPLLTSRAERQLGLT